MLCPICGKEHETKTNRVETVDEFKGDLVAYCAEVSVCPETDDVYLTEEQVRENRTKMLDAYRKNKGLLSRRDISEICYRHSISSILLSKMIGEEDSYILDILNGVKCQSPEVDGRIREADAELQKQLLCELGIKEKK